MKLFMIILSEYFSDTFSRASGTDCAYVDAEIKFQSSLARWARRLLLGTLTVGRAYLLILVHPQPLFATSWACRLVVHATRPIPDAMRATLDRVRVRLDRTPLADKTHVDHIFICDAPWLFALFARTITRSAASRMCSSASMCSCARATWSTTG